MRRAGGLSIVVLMACASPHGGQAPQQGAVETISVPRGSGSMNIPTVRSTTTGVATIASPVERVWGVLPAVYGSLGIPIATQDAESRVIGSSGLKLRRRLGNVSLTKYLDCGSSQGGPSADTYEIFLTVLTRATPGASGETTLSTTVEATGRPVSFSSGDVRCTTTGALEGRIAEGVKGELKG
jgi:hypothetical protein